MKTAQTFWRRALRATTIATLLFFSAFVGDALAADMCMGPGQILVPDSSGNAVCLAGYAGSSNCNAVSNPRVVMTGNGHLTCVAGPSCPTGYLTGLPPTVGSPAGTSTGASACQARCVPVFTKHGWPCSCPYGQHLNASTGICAPTCGPSATWQHTPGATWQQTQTFEGGGSDTYLSNDPGICTCPVGESLTSSGDCAPICPPDQQYDSGVCKPRCTAPQAWNPQYNACMIPPTNYGCTPPAKMVKGVCLACPVGQTYNTSKKQCTPSSGNSDGGDEGAGSYTPSSPIGAPHSCPKGQSWNGVHCMKPSQPGSTGNEGSGAYNPGTSIGGDHSCPEGQTWNGLHCMKPSPPVGAANPCPPLSTWTGSACMGPRGKLFCLDGMVLQGRVCVAGQTTTGPCPPLSTWTGEVCIGPRGKSFCPQGMTMQGRVCVADRTPSICPPLSTWTGQVCVGPRGKAFCPEGMTMRGGVCVR